MKIAYIKTILKNFRRIRISNFFLDARVQGNRNDSSYVIGWGNFRYKFHKGAQINIRNGVLNLNKIFSRPDSGNGILKMMENSRLNIAGGFDIYSGHEIAILDNAELNLGSGYINKNATIRCHQKITIGKNVAISENFVLLDSDSHCILGQEDKMTQPVKIGNRVWIGTNVTVLKGATIGDGAVIAAGAVVVGNIPPNCVAAGVPAKIIKENIEWR